MQSPLLRWPIKAVFLGLVFLALTQTSDCLVGVRYGPCQVHGRLGVGEVLVSELVVYLVLTWRKFRRPQ